MVNLKDMSLEQLDILMEEITKEKSNRITEKLISQLEQYNKLIQELSAVARSILNTYDELSENEKDKVYIHEDIEYLAEEPILYNNPNKFFTVINLTTTKHQKGNYFLSFFYADFHFHILEILENPYFGNFNARFWKLKIEKSS